MASTKKVKFYELLNVKHNNDLTTDYTGSKSISDLPNELLVKILGQVYTFPLMFNLCCVNKEWNIFIHKHFKNIGIVNVQTYSKMDKIRNAGRTRNSLPRGRNIEEQMENIVVKWNHILNGLKFNGNAETTSLVGQMQPVLAVLRMCGSQDTFKAFHFRVTLNNCDRSFRRQEYECLRSLSNIVQFNLVHITELELTLGEARNGWCRDDVYWKLHQIGFDLSNLVNLKSVDFTKVYITQWPSSIISLKFDCFGYNPAELTVLLIMLGERLEILVLDFDEIDDGPSSISSDSNNDLQLPSLKVMKLIYYMSEMSMDGLCVFDLSRSTRLHTLDISLHSPFIIITVKDLDFTKCPGLTSLTVSQQHDDDDEDYGILFTPAEPSSFMQADLNYLTVMHIDCKFEFSIIMLRRLSLGCEQIKVAYFVINADDRDDEISCAQLVPSIMQNCQQLEEFGFDRMTFPVEYVAGAIAATYCLDNFMSIAICVPGVCPTDLASQLLSESLSDCNVRSILGVYIEANACKKHGSSDICSEPTELIQQLSDNFEIWLDISPSKDPPGCRKTEFYRL